MEATGERPILPGEIQVSRLRYRALLPYVTDQNVLDFGCGIGHGSYLLAQGANQVIGYEPCPEALQEAQKTFKAPNLEFRSQFNPDVLQEIDLVAMVEVFEHMEKPQAEDFLQTVSQSGCDLALTTPNGDYFPYHPATPADRRGFHLWHYTYLELKALGEKYFKFSEVYCHLCDVRIGVFTSYMMFCSNDPGLARMVQVE